MSGVTATRISPLGPDAFTDDDFAAVFVTDRGGPNISQNNTQEINQT
jgi:hypothetical protein